MRHVALWLAWWLAFFWLWLLLAGEWNQQEWIAAAGAAAIAATLAEVARTRVGGALGLPRRALADVPQALAMVVVDFAILVRALVTSALRRRVVRGEFREHDVPEAGPWTALLASLSSNA